MGWSNSNVLIAQATLHKTFLSIQGTQAKPVRDVRLLGIGMRDTALSYLDAHSARSDPPSPFNVYLHTL